MPLSSSWASYSLQPVRLGDGTERSVLRVVKTGAAVAVTVFRLELPALCFNRNAVAIGVEILAGYDTDRLSDSRPHPDHHQDEGNGRQKEMGEPSVANHP